MLSNSCPGSMATIGCLLSFRDLWISMGGMSGNFPSLSPPINSLLRLSASFLPLFHLWLHFSYLICFFLLFCIERPFPRINQTWPTTLNPRMNGPLEPSKVNAYRQNTKGIALRYVQYPKMAELSKAFNQGTHSVKGSPPDLPDKSTAIHLMQ